MKVIAVRISSWVLMWSAAACLAGAGTNLPAQSASGSLHGSAEKAPDQLLLGKALGAAGKWKQAEAELRSYRNRHPGSENAIVLHAEALMRIGQPFDAALELQEFLKEHPKALRAHELYAVVAAGPLKDSLLTASELETCVRLAPNDFQAWVSLGDLDLDGAKADQAIDAYSHATRLRPNDPVAAASLAHAYAEQGSGDKAAAQFKRARALTRSSAEPEKNQAIVDYLYGVYLAGQGQGQESVTALSSALHFNPRSAEAYYWRARGYEKLKDFKNAEHDALEAIKLSPSSKEAPLFLITLYRKAGDMENAQKYADLAKKLADQEQAEASFGRSLRDSLDKAEPLLRQGQFAEALPLYESIVKQLPTFYEAYFDLGMCYGQTGRPREAEEQFRKYLVFQPVSADGHAALGVLLLGENRGQEAAAELTQAIQIDPGAAEARKALGAEYLRESNPRAAAEALKPEANSKDGELLTMLAAALAQAGDYRLARVETDRALAIDPRDPAALKLDAELKSRIAKRPRE